MWAQSIRLPLISTPAASWGGKPRAVISKSGQESDVTMHVRPTAPLGWSPAKMFATNFPFFPLSSVASLRSDPLLPPLTMAQSLSLFLAATLPLASLARPSTYSSHGGHIHEHYHNHTHKVRTTTNPKNGSSLPRLAIQISGALNCLTHSHCQPLPMGLGVRRR